MSSKLPTTAALICAVALPVAAGAQNPQQDPAERARNIARQLEQNARTLTLYDRQGKVISTIAEKHIFNQPTLSPDAARIALIKPDLEKEPDEPPIEDGQKWK